MCVGTAICHHCCVQSVCKLVRSIVIRTNMDHHITQSRDVGISDFSEYFKRLTPANNKRNPWFKEYWETHFRCSIGQDRRESRCSG